jgi:hypothetical protein
MSDETDDARRYLEEFLTARDIALSHASTALGYSHAYIQQYIKNGTPKYLSEADRELLVSLYGLDGERLKPPPKEPKPLPNRRGVNGGDVDSQVGANLTQQMQNARLLAFWKSLDDEIKVVALELFEVITRKKSG